MGLCDGRGKGTNGKYSRDSRARPGPIQPTAGSAERLRAPCYPPKMNGSHPLPAAVRRHLDADPRPVESRRLLVAVSGGADSVALLRGLHALAPERGLELVVAPLDHGLRGAAAAEDAAFVTALAASLSVLPVVNLVAMSFVPIESIGM